MRSKMNSNRYKISFRLKILLQCWVSSLLVFTWIEAKWIQNGLDFIPVILTEMKFQTSMRFLCEHNLPQTNWISADSFHVASTAHVRLKLNASMYFISIILTDMKISNWYEFISSLMWTHCKIFAKVSFCKISGFYYKQIIELFWLTSFPAHLTAIRGRRKNYFLTIALETKLLF